MGKLKGGWERGRRCAGTRQRRRRREDHETRQWRRRREDHETRQWRSRWEGHETRQRRRWEDHVTSQQRRRREDQRGQSFTESERENTQRSQSRARRNMAPPGTCNKLRGGNGTTKKITKVGSAVCLVYTVFF
ncbi:hypothetical protein NDU88_008469 [Pleurodeles waltl]|uniref:Uncharacterized protein n=1 Tax=Pleurodeles waltl TaxID=8319 RepID=A0AAV7RW68_PLEWA|nr:hypothetical protein NDU88_008469 [Pleurodeles waltl]